MTHTRRKKVQSVGFMKSIFFAVRSTESYLSLWFPFRAVCPLTRLLKREREKSWSPWEQSGGIQQSLTRSGDNSITHRCGAEGQPLNLLMMMVPDFPLKTICKKSRERERERITGRGGGEERTKNRNIHSNTKRIATDKNHAY